MPLLMLDLDNTLVDRDTASAIHHVGGAPGTAR
jgi:hypothetical protein